MTSIPSSPITTNPTAADIQSAKLKCQSAQTGSFEALFAIFSSDQSSSSNSTNTASSGSTTQANGSISGIFDILLSENSAAPDSSGSNFSSDFDNAFGTSGPLFDFKPELIQECSADNVPAPLKRRPESGPAKYLHRT